MEWRTCLFEGSLPRPLLFYSSFYPFNPSLGPLYDDISFFGLAVLYIELWPKVNFSPNVQFHFLHRLLPECTLFEFRLPSLVVCPRLRRSLFNRFYPIDPPEWTPYVYILTCSRSSEKIKNPSCSVPFFSGCTRVYRASC